MSLAARKIRLIMLLRRSGINDTAVLAAVERIPREDFVPESFHDQSYEDKALPIGQGQTISQPQIVALMTQALELTPRHKVLEIGTGSGYQAAVLSRLSRRVYTIERHRPLLQEAEQRFAKLRIHNITSIAGDGMKGWPAQAPFDRIIITAAAAELPETLSGSARDRRHHGSAHRTRTRRSGAVQGSASRGGHRDGEAMRRSLRTAASRRTAGAGPGMTSRGALGLLLLLALAACNNNGGGSAVTLPPSGPASYKIGEAQNYTVIAGDTIDGVAQQFNMPVEALIAANHLVYPYALHAGQTLFIPGRGAPGAGTGYVVVAGDTLTRIARHNGTTVAALAALNGLVPPYVIKVGQRLTLPGGSPTQTAAVAGATPAASASGGEMIQFPPAEPAPPVPAAGSVKVATEALSTPTGASATPSTQASEPTASQSAAAPPPVLLQPAKPRRPARARPRPPRASPPRARRPMAPRLPAATDAGGAIDLQHPGLQPAGAGAPTTAAPTTAAHHRTQHQRRLTSRSAAAGARGGCSTCAPRLGKIPLARQRQGGVGLRPQGRRAA